MYQVCTKVGIWSPCVATLVLAPIQEPRLLPSRQQVPLLRHLGQTRDRAAIPRLSSEAIAKMQVNRSSDSILYRSGMDPKMKRTFKYSRRAISSQRSRSTFQISAFRWCVTTAGIPTRCATSAGSVPRRHRRRPRASPRQQAQQGCGAKVSAAIEIIEHLALKPLRIPSRSWRELIKHDQTSLGSRSAAVSL